jgi:hypothetical protein
MSILIYESNVGIEVVWISSIVPLIMGGNGLCYAEAKRYLLRIQYNRSAVFLSLLLLTPKYCSQSSWWLEDVLLNGLWGLALFLLSMHLDDDLSTVQRLLNSIFNLLLYIKILPCCYRLELKRNPDNDPFGVETIFCLFLRVLLSLSLSAWWLTLIHPFGV